MGSISPVLQSFLAGQQQAADIADKQKNYQLQKEHIDAIVDEMKTRGKQEQQRIAIEQQAHQLASDISHQNAVRQLRQDLANGLIKPQTTNYEVPPALEGLGANPNNPEAGQQVAVPNPVQHFNIPGMGNTDISNFNMPEDLAAQNARAAAMQTAATEGTKLPFELTKIRETAAANVEPRLAAMETIADEKLKAAMAIANNKNASAFEVQQAKNEALIARTQLENTRGLITAGIPPEVALSGQSMTGMQGQLAKYAKKHGDNVALGQEDLKDLTPLIRAQTESYMADNGLVKAPKDISKVFDLGENAVKIQNGITNLKASIGVPSSIGEKTRNILVNKVGLEGLSPYKSQFDMFKTSLLPVLDTAVGLTPGTLARSPKLYDKLTGILPQVGDSDEIISRKMFNANDIFLTSMQGKISNLPTEQKKLIWSKVIESNPELLNNALTAEQLKKAIESGHYSSGSILDSHLKALGLK